MRSAALAAIMASTTILSGCAGTVAGVSLSSISSFAGFASTLFTGADLGEHAASLVTGKDCRFSEGLVREDRDICEEPGSPATRDDFHGIFVERIDTDGTVIYAAPKYMPASVGAGENENNTDVVWAQIKAQKSQEESQRQLARSERAQQIDVAALASGSLSAESLGFLPTGTVVSAKTIDEEPASQTAARPRNVSNSAAKSSTKVSSIPVAVSEDPPALDEKSFTAAMRIANATGEGGPFIAPNTNSTTVASTLVNGEPVLVMKLGPVVSPLSSFSAAPSEAPAETQAAPVELSSLPAEPISPQALVSSAPKAPAKKPEKVALTQLPTEIAAPAAKAPVSKPKSKPAAEITEPEAVKKPAKAKPAVAEPAPAPQISPEDDAYQPPASDVLNSPAPDLLAAPQNPPAAEPRHEPRAADAPAANNSPAPLIPMAQP